MLDVGAAEGSMAGELTRRGFIVTCLGRDLVLAEQAAVRCDRMLICDLDRAIPLLYRETQMETITPARFGRGRIPRLNPPRPATAFTFPAHTVSE